MRQFLFTVPYMPPEQAFTAFADKPFSLFLDSADPANKLNQFSVIAFEPVETITVRQDRTEIRNREFRLKLSGNPFHHVRRRLKDWADNIQQLKNAPMPFTGGVAGYFGYDLVRFLEKLPGKAENDLNTPDMALGMYHQVLGFDLDKKAAYYVATAADQKAADHMFQVLSAKLDNVRKNTVQPQSKSIQEWSRGRKQTAYQEDIQTVIDYIHAGDIFQANLAQRFQANLPEGFDNYAYYLHLRSVNPSPFASYMNFGAFQILSCSPERFLKVENGKVETRPIKGTLSSDKPADNLKNSEKDRSENIMIVDLLRNDLSKVCDPFSVQVPELCAIETYAGLHHMVSAVTGTLRPGKSAFDALEACFPGGSITGAPKVRAMEIIESLEPFHRGPYCGAIGFIDFNGTMDTNIIIRTMVFKNNQVTFHVGGGIVADSNAVSEYQETLLKARKIFESFETIEFTQHPTREEKAA